MYINKHAPLTEMGYQPIPIAAGFKYPAGIDEWETLRPTAEDWAYWSEGSFRDGGVGILLGTPETCIGAIDVDVYDAEICQEICAELEMVYGLSMYRIGESPKRLYPVRMAGAYTKSFTGRYLIPGYDPLSRVEILGHGQQFVAYGIHPDIQRPYQWYNGTLTDTPVAELPLVTQADIRAIIERCDQILAKHGQCKARSTFGANAESYDMMMHRKQKPLAMSPVEVGNVLDNLPPSYREDYDQWVQVGMALHHQFEGEENGLILWDLFSAPGTEYKGVEDLEFRWNGFDSGRGGRAVTLRSLKKVAELNGMKPVDENGEPVDPLTGMLKRYVYVAAGQFVYDRVDPPSAQMLTLQEFHSDSANLRMLIPAEREGGKDTYIPYSKLWMTDERRVSVQGSTYHPDTGLIISNESGKTYINTCYLPSFEPVNDYKRIHIFMEHMEYLCPCPKDRAFFLDWLAYTLQSPHLRSKVVPLHIAPLEGTGRSWMEGLLEKLLDISNVSTCSFDNLAGTGDGGQFQEFLINKLVTVVNEAASEGKNKFSIGSKLKNVLIDPMLNLNSKYAGKGTTQVFSNILLFSNSRSGFVISATDRRLHVIAGPEFLQDAGYYNRLYGALDDPRFIREVYQYLTTRNVDPKENLHRAAMTDAKKAMIEGGKSNIQASLTGVLAELALQYPGLTCSQVTAATIKKQRTDMTSDMEITEKNVRMALRQMEMEVRYPTGATLGIYALKKGASDAVLIASVEKYDAANPR